MPSEDTKILDFNHYQKSDKAPIIIYADLERLWKVDGHVPSGFSMSTISSFKSLGNRNVVCRGIDLVKKLLRILKRTRNGDN